MVDCSPGSAWNGAVCEPTSEPAMPDCSLLEQPDRYVLEVPYPWLYADRDASWAQRVLEYDLPAGRYNVSAFAWDGYNGREEVVQPQEQFKVEFYRGAAKIAETAATPDLPDRQREASWEGEIASDLDLRQNTTQIRLQHTAYPSSNPNSVAAVCVAFDCVEEGCPEVFTSRRENYPICPFAPQEDRLIVHFDQPRWSSDTNPAFLHRVRETCGSGSSCRTVSTDKVAILPPASYRVTAFSWDGYPGRAGTIQDERWKIQLFQNEALLAETAPTEDVDNWVDSATWTGVIADELVLPSMANTVRAENVGGGSVLSICTAFDCLEPGCLDVDEPKVEVVASKIVCDDPDEMPRFSNTGKTIESDTAQRWVAENDSCDFADGWQFQRAINSTPSGTTDNAGLLFGWNTFGPTVGGAATTSIFLAEFEDPENDRILVREAWQSGYAPFAGYSGSSDSESVSAEMYCHDDVIGFDNLEAINGVEAGETYHCVAWNHPESVTLMGTDCDITRAGHDTCSSFFTWSIQDATSPNLYNSSMGEQYTGSAFGDSQAFRIQYGDNIVQLRDGSDVEREITVTTSCGSSLEWDEDLGVCVPDDGETPWATIEASGCIIPAGESTCQATMSWQSGNTTEGARSVRHSYPEGGSSHISGQPEGEATRSLSFGRNEFQFRNEGDRIARTRVAAACDAELMWDGSVCQPEIPDCPEGTWWDGEACAAPELNLELASSVIRQGETTQVRWGITNISSIDVDFTCTLRGAGLDEGFSDITEDREISRNIEGESPLTTPPVLNAFDVRLQCTETGTNAVFSAIERLEVVPAPREN